MVHSGVGSFSHGPGWVLGPPHAVTARAIESAIERGPRGPTTVTAVRMTAPALLDDGAAGEVTRDGRVRRALERRTRGRLQVDDVSTDERPVRAERERHAVEEHRAR